MSIRDRKIAAARAQGFAQILSVVGPDRKRIDMDCPERQRREAEWLERRTTWNRDPQNDADVQRDHDATDSRRGWPEN